jgi:hypothetical protein
VASSSDTFHIVEGWGQIAAHVSARTGISVSVDSAVRWAKQSGDALPVRKWGRARPRVIARADELDAWCDRQWRDVHPGRRHGEGGQSGAA